MGYPSDYPSYQYHESGKCIPFVKTLLSWKSLEDVAKNNKITFSKYLAHFDRNLKHYFLSCQIIESKRNLSCDVPKNTVDGWNAAPVDR